MPPIETVTARLSRAPFDDVVAMVAEMNRQVLLASSMMPPALVMGMDSMQDCPCQDCRRRRELGLPRPMPG